MGVLDLLPHCVSGVYFIYHSDYSKFSFGKISALREACLALEGGYQYYYMGYYIHTCQKMKYKNDYSPQYVLDLETYGWDPLDENMKTLLDRQRYVSMSKERRVAPSDAQRENMGDSSVEEVPTVVTLTNNSNRQTFSSAALASDAVGNSVSLFEVNFPGMMTVEEVEAAVDLDAVRVALGQDQLVQCQVCGAKDISHFPCCEQRRVVPFADFHRT
jgi:hypothetical protein